MGVKKDGLVYSEHYHLAYAMLYTRQLYILRLIFWWVSCQARYEFGYTRKASTIQNTRLDRQLKTTMPKPIVSSVEHAFCVIMAIIIMAVAPLGVTAMPSPTPKSPILLSPSPSYQPVKNLQVQIRREQNHIPSGIMEDYDYWNPSPYFDRGNAAPIPHRHVVEDSFHTDHDMASDGRTWTIPTFLMQYC